MQARLRVAAMDHNHSTDREFASTLAGSMRFKLEYSKPAGRYTVKPIKVQKDYSFRKELVAGIADRCSRGNIIDYDIWLFPFTIYAYINVQCNIVYMQ